MKIVTGYTGNPHISSNDDQAKNQGEFGTGNYVLDVGNKFGAVLTNATTVTIKDGDGVMQGVHFRIEPGGTEAVAISPGTTGYNRHDLICAKYTKDAGTGVEDVSLIVLEGSPVTGAAEDPEYESSDILLGGSLAYFPLWRVSLSGLTPTLEQVFCDRLKRSILWESGIVPESIGSGQYIVQEMCDAQLEKGIYYVCGNVQIQGNQNQITRISIGIERVPLPTNPNYIYQTGVMSSDNRTAQISVSGIIEATENALARLGIGISTTGTDEVTIYAELTACRI